jgi:hypothetical protein
LNNGERYEDPSVSSSQREVIVHEDCEGNGDWIVDYFDDDGGCYVTIFCGPENEKRARDYFHALKSRRLKTIRATRCGPAVIAGAHPTSQQNE